MKYIIHLFIFSAFIFSGVKTQSKFNAPEKAVLKFYRWYLKDIYLKKSVESPEVKLTRDSVYQIDATNHIEFIKRSGYFSSKFYPNEIPMFSACNKQLIKVNPKEVIESGGFPSAFVNGNDCSFLEYKVWTGGQGERLNTVDVVGSIIFGDSAEVNAVVGDSLSGPYSYPRVSLFKEHNKWLISRIIISYDKSNK
jgi:hypothetical protein